MMRRKLQSGTMGALIAFAGAELASTETWSGGDNITDVYLRRPATNVIAILAPTATVRVGIGTATPSRELQVSGSVQAVRFYLSTSAWLQLDASGTNLLFIANQVTNRLN